MSPSDEGGGKTVGFDLRDITKGKQILNWQFVNCPYGYIFPQFVGFGVYDEPGWVQTLNGRFVNRPYGAFAE